VLRVQEVTFQGEQLLMDTSSGVMRPLVPLQVRRQIFENIHSLAHPGIRASRRLIGSRFLWPNLAKDVVEWCRQYTRSQGAKVTRQATAEVQPIATPIQGFSHIHVDLVGPLPVSSEGFAYLLTVVDHTSRWFEAVPLHSVTAAAVADTFVTTPVAITPPSPPTAASSFHRRFGRPQCRS
jgi:cleavage and polyadenylation specificity factor subunit 1